MYTVHRECVVHWSIYLHTQMLAKRFLSLFSELVAMETDLPSPSYRACGGSECTTSVLRVSPDAHLILVSEGLVGPAVILLHMGTKPGYWNGARLPTRLSGS